MDALESMWAAVDRISEVYAVAERPPNSFTLNEYAARRKVPPATAQKQLKRLVDRGELKTHKVLTLDDGGVHRRTNVYTVV